MFAMGETAGVTGVMENHVYKFDKEIRIQFIISSGLYVDDDNLVFFTLPQGTRWSEEGQRMVVLADHLNEGLDLMMILGQ